jgi:anti-anti-sigma factor
MLDGRFPFEVVNGVPVVTAPEEIDITNAAELRTALLEAAAHGHGTLVVDMTRTRFCDSSGLHTLLAAHKRAQAEDGELLLAITAAPARLYISSVLPLKISNRRRQGEAHIGAAVREGNGLRHPIRDCNFKGVTPGTRRTDEPSEEGTP